VVENQRVAEWATAKLGLWRGPEDELQSAARRGELRVAQLRIAVLCVLCVTPLFHLIDGTLPPEGWIGVGFFALALTLALLAYRRAKTPFLSPMIGFASSALDVSLVTVPMAVDAIFVDPYIGTNSQFIFMIYILAIGATALRYDARVCVTTGALAIVQHLAVVAFCVTRYPIAEPGAFSVEYGVFSWHTVIARSLILAAHTYLCWVIVRRASSLWQRSVRDLRTGLYNRSFFDEKLHEEFARWRRHQRSFAVAMFDLDHFKTINDSYGHAFGDEILEAIGSCLLRGMRDEDAACRYGGDEFVLLLTEIDAPSAIRRIEELIAEIADLALRPAADQVGPRLTFSVGVAFAGHDARTSRELLAVADERLYEAKNGGRNRIATGGHERRSLSPVEETG